MYAPYHSWHYGDGKIFSNGISENVYANVSNEDEMLRRWNDDSTKAEYYGFKSVQEFRKAIG